MGGADERCSEPRARATCRAEPQSANGRSHHAGASGSRSVPLHQDIYMLGALSGVAALLAAWSLPLWIGAWQVVCPLRALTGIPCPTCFGTRALLALMAGEWRTALAFNPLVAAGAMGLFVAVPWAAGTAMAGWPRLRWSRGRTVGFAWAAVLSLAANWIYLLMAHP